MKCEWLVCSSIYANLIETFVEAFALMVLIVSLQCWLPLTAKVQ